MTLSSRKRRFLYKKSGALHYKVSPDNFFLSSVAPGCYLRLELLFTMPVL